MHVSFSFRAICETLDIDADELARALLGMGDGESGDASSAAPAGADAASPRVAAPLSAAHAGRVGRVSG